MKQTVAPATRECVTACLSIPALLFRLIPFSFLFLANAEQQNDKRCMSRNLVVHYFYDRKPDSRRSFQLQQSVEEDDFLTSHMSELC